MAKPRAKAKSSVKSKAKVKAAAKPKAKAKLAARPKAVAAADDAFIWVRVPRDTSLDRLRELGGGAITVAGASAARLRKVLEAGGLNPAAACFGGDTCIV